MQKPRKKDVKFRIILGKGVVVKAKWQGYEIEIKHDDLCFSPSLITELTNEAYKALLEKIQ